jgi:hypothetical protein
MDSLSCCSCCCSIAWRFSIDGRRQSRLRCVYWPYSGSRLHYSTFSIGRTFSTRESDVRKRSLTKALQRTAPDRPSILNQRRRTHSAIRKNDPAGSILLRSNERRDRRARRGSTFLFLNRLRVEELLALPYFGATAALSFPCFTSGQNLSHSKGRLNSPW